MQIVSIFFTLGILIFVGLFLYAPFIERRAQHVTEDEQELSALLAERERTLSSLQELESDYSLGKVPEEDYPAQRAGLLQTGAEILRKLDEISSQRAPDDKDTQLELAIASRRKNGIGKSAERIDEEIESMISSRRMGRKEKSVGFCPKCGKPVMASDKFCPACGKALI